MQVWEQLATLKANYGRQHDEASVATVKAIQEGFIPPTINLDEPDPECDLDYVPKVGQKLHIRAAVKNSMGFGGQNAVVAGSAVIPGFPGFYVTLFQMPAGVAAGRAPVSLRINGLTSNTVMMNTR